MTSGIYPRKTNYNGIPPIKRRNMNDETRERKTKEREETRKIVLNLLELRTGARISVPRISGTLIHEPAQDQHPIFLHVNRLYKKRYITNMKKVIVPCSCGLKHAILWQVMTPTEIQERVKVEQVKENNITISMTDMFFQKPLEPPV